MQQITQEYNTTRSGLFLELRDKYGQSPNNKPISAEDITQLKTDLEHMNSQKVAKLDDVANSLGWFDELNMDHTVLQETILPLLLQGHTLENNARASTLMLDRTTDTPHIVSSLLYTYGASLKLFNRQGEKALQSQFLPTMLISLNNRGFTIDGTRYIDATTENYVTYLKTLFTPPASVVEKAVDSARPAITTVMLCLAELKKENPTSYGLPKPVIKVHILPGVIQNAISKEITDRCQTVHAEVCEQIKMIQENSASEENTKSLNGLYASLDTWTDIGALTYAALMKNK
jgi:hypothetical protein